MHILKRILAISLAFLLLLSHFGVHAKSHYCMGRLTHLQFFALEENSSANLCACGETYEKSGCCHDVEVHASNDELGIGQSSLSLPKMQLDGKVTYASKFFRFEPKLTQVPIADNVWFRTLAPPQWLISWEITKLLI